MKFTVMGHGGFIGSHLVRHLRAIGEDVSVPARGDPALFDQPLGHLIYAVGLTADFRTRPLETVQAHVCLLRDVLARASFDSLLYLSSTRVYAGQHSTSEASSLQVDPTQAGDLYNLSKLMGESLTLHSGHRCTRVARLSNVIGEQGMPVDNFVPAIAAQALNGRVSLQTSLDSAKDYIDIADVVALLHGIAARGAERVYNVASGANLSHRDWVTALANNLPFELDAGPELPTTRFSPIQIARLEAEFGRPSRSVLDRLPAILRAIEATQAARTSPDT